MKRKTSAGIIAGVAIGVTTLVSTLDMKVDMPIQTLESRYVAEFVDRNKNGYFEGYRVLKIRGDKEEYLAPTCHSWHSPEYARDIFFHTPFGGTMSGEFDKEYLTSVYKNVGYPNVDEIKFIE